MLKFGFAVVTAAFLVVGVTPVEAASAPARRVAVKVDPTKVKPVCAPRVVPSRH